MDNMPETSHSRSIPRLGMLVDRTSFDETDNYGIDRSVIVDNIPAGKLNVPTCTVLKNGRVRRRLRWRPKRHNDRGMASEATIDEESQITQPAMIRTVSSNASVNSHSNVSLSSRTSTRSAHSFSSTATMPRDNTKQAGEKARRFPLPRPNYPSTFDGVSTIGNEADMVHARIRGVIPRDSSPATVFAAADLDGVDHHHYHHPEQDQDGNYIYNNLAVDSSAQEVAGGNPEFPRTCSTPKKRTFPPLFRRKPPIVPQGKPKSLGLSHDAETPPMSPNAASSREILSQPIASHSVSSNNNLLLLPQLSPKGCMPSYEDKPSSPASPLSRQAPLSFTNDSSLPLAPPDLEAIDLPLLEEDVLDTERTVDLRIPEHRQTESSQIDTQTLETRDTAVVQSSSSTTTTISTRPSTAASLSSSSLVQEHKAHPLKWSNSESAMTTVALTNCVDFLLSADLEDINPAGVGDAAEIRFSMSEIGRSFSEPVVKEWPKQQQQQQQLLAYSANANTPKTNSKTRRLSTNRGTKPPLPPNSRSVSISNSSPFSPPVSPKPLVTTPKSPISPSRLPATSSFSVDSKPADGEQSSSLSQIPPPLSVDAGVAASENCISPDSASLSSRISVPVNVDDGSFLDVEKNLQAIHDMGIEHLRHGEYAEALEVFEEILRGQLTRYGEKHFRVGTALHNIGIVHMKQGDYEEAAHVTYEAVRIRRLSLPPDHPDIAVSLAQLGVAQLECHKFKKAITHFREALRIRRRCYGPKHLKVAKLLNNIGCALYELNELEVAKIAFEEALEIQRSTLRQVPSQDLEEPANQILLSIASTLSNIGSIKLYWGRNVEATVDLEEALLIQQSVLGDDHPFAKRTEACLEWMESKEIDSSDEDGEDNSVAHVLRPKTGGGGVRLCQSSAISAERPRDDLSYMIEVFNQNLWRFKTGIEFPCQGDDTTSNQETNSTNSSPSRPKGIIL